jgi:hypothetical protein
MKNSLSIDRGGDGGGSGDLPRLSAVPCLVSWTRVNDCLMHLYAEVVRGGLGRGTHRVKTGGLARDDSGGVTRFEIDKGGGMARVVGRSGEGWTPVSRRQQRTSSPATIGSGGVSQHIANLVAAAQPLANSGFAARPFTNSASVARPLADSALAARPLANLVAAERPLANSDYFCDATSRKFGFSGATSREFGFGGITSCEFGFSGKTSR